MHCCPVCSCWFSESKRHPSSYACCWDAHHWPPGSSSYLKVWACCSLCRISPTLDHQSLFLGCLPILEGLWFAMLSRTLLSPLPLGFRSFHRCVTISPSRVKILGKLWLPAVLIRSQVIFVESLLEDQVRGRDAVPWCGDSCWEGLLRCLWKGSYHTRIWSILRRWKYLCWSNLNLQIF